MEKKGDLYMAQPRTIDNLGPEAYTRYAEDQKLYDEKLVSEARGVQLQAEIDVTIPSYGSEYEALFETSKRNQFWADFFAPPKYNEQKRRLFTYQIVPSLGSPDKKEAQAQRIIDMVAVNKKNKESAEAVAKSDNRTLAWERIRELEDEEHEKSVLLHLLNQVSDLERVLIDINSRRGQYQKG